MSPPPLRTPEPLTRESLPGAADAIAAGFGDNEIWVWMVPRDRLRGPGLRRYYRVVLRKIFEPMGQCWVSGDRMGAAIWNPPERWQLTKREQRAELRAMLPWLSGGLTKGQRIEALMKEHHPREPHWYLHTLSIDPRRQRMGYGSALIEPGLARADRERLPCYLETQRESNIPFYARFGFELQRQISLPESPPLWTMWRPAPRT